MLESVCKLNGCQLLLPQAHIATPCEMSYHELVTTPYAQSVHKEMQLSWEASDQVGFCFSPHSAWGLYVKYF